MSGLDDTQWSSDVKCHSCCEPLPGRWREDSYIQCGNCEAEGYVTQGYDGTWTNAEDQDDEELSMFQWIERAKTAEAKLAALKTEIAEDERTRGIDGRFDHLVNGYQGGVMFSRREIETSRHPVGLIDVRLSNFRDMMLAGIKELGWLK